MVPSAMSGYRQLRTEVPGLPPRFSTNDLRRSWNNRFAVGRQEAGLTDERSRRTEPRAGRVPHSVQSENYLGLYNQEQTAEINMHMQDEAVAAARRPNDEHGRRNETLRFPDRCQGDSLARRRRAEGAREKDGVERKDGRDHRRQSRGPGARRRPRRAAHVRGGVNELAPVRINEVPDTRYDCRRIERTTRRATGEEVQYLGHAYNGSKNAPDSTKWIPSVMVDIADRCRGRGCRRRCSP
ncbi:hypothetical protein SAMN05216573_12297 [Bradyrhizobium sp. Rc3b]|nr:hypothetical protein SAMN05216573_12297 [Bradyrhizobium sp. Rc3b]